MVEGVPAHGRGRNKLVFRVPPNPNLYGHPFPSLGVQKERPVRTSSPQPCRAPAGQRRALEAVTSQHSQRRGHGPEELLAARLLLIWELYARKRTPSRPAGTKPALNAPALPGLPPERPRAALERCRRLAGSLPAPARGLGTCSRCGDRVWCSLSCWHSVGCSPRCLVLLPIPGERHKTGM